jgi:hypothetical protein
MNNDYSSRFNGIVKMEKKEVNVRFGRIGIYDPGFVVTSFEDNVGMLLKKPRRSKNFVIAHRNFFLTEYGRKKLETQLNRIIYQNGLLKKAA